MFKRTAVVLIAALMFLACVKQTPEMPPGAAAIQNLKTSVHVAQVATASAKDALPILEESGDLKGDDLEIAIVIVDDVDKGLAVLDRKIAPYTSFNSDNGAEIKKAVTDLLDTLKEMQREGVTHIKNPKARARVELGLNLASGALSLWQPPSSP